VSQVCIGQWTPTGLDFYADGFYDDNDDITLTVHVQFSTLISIPCMSMCITFIQIVRRINLNALKMAVVYQTH